MSYALKQIHHSGIPAALEKADKYRELNQPAEAESICLDVLAIDAGNQLALRILGLALTDRLEPRSGQFFNRARQTFAQLRDPYERAFYGGIACERQAKAQLAALLPLASVRPLFEQALAGYAEAERIRPAGNDDSILRWNSCVRALAGAGTEHDTPVDWEADSAPQHR